MDISDQEKTDVQRLYAELLCCDRNDLKSTNIKTLLDILTPDSLLERFAARKAAGVAAGRDFVDIKGF